MEEQQMTEEEFKILHPIGSGAGYHGETIEITEYLNDCVIVHFRSNGEDREISIEELIEQNY